MVDFVSMAQTAKRLIDANGRTVTLIQQGNTPLDSDKPWRGTDTYPRATVPGRAAFVSLDSKNEDSLKRADQAMLFAAEDDLGLSLEDFDQVEDGNVLWQIVHVAVIGPADTRVLYRFEVKR